jgi:L-iditol 2-dehydrogenase
MANRALYLVGPARFELREAPEPPPPAGRDVLLRVRACSFCGSDFTYSKMVEHSPEAPQILGHEFIGEVERVGPDVAGLRVGDRVAADAGVSCGRCERCRSGNPNLCSSTRFYGFGGCAGGLQERLLFPASHCIAIPDDLSDEVAVQAEPLAVCLHALALARAALGESAVVLGAGPIGLMIVRLLRHAGVNPIAVTEPLEHRRKLALQYGASLALDPRDPAMEASILEHTRGGADVVFEAAGSSDAIRLTPRLARPGARVILVGIPPVDEFPISHVEARTKGLTILLVRRMRRTLERAVRLLHDGLTLPGMISHRVTLADAERAFQVASAGAEDAVKVLVTP